MFKAFTAGLFGILLSTSLGAIAASQGGDRNSPVNDLGASHIAQQYD